MGSKTFWKAQYGRESTRGTNVATTRIWPGSVTVPDSFTPVYPNYNLGVKAKAAQSHIHQYLVDPITFDMPDGAFQYMPFAASLVLKGNVTAAEQTADQDDYLWPMQPSLTATGRTTDSVSLEYGDDDQAYETSYVTGKSLKLSGTLGQNAPVAISVEAFGQRVTKTTFTAANTFFDPVEPMSANMARIWIDSAWGSVGTTEKTDFLRSFELVITNGSHPKWLGGSRSFSKHGENWFEARLTLDVEGGSTAVAEFDASLLRTQRAVRFALDGSQIGSGDNHNVTFDGWMDVMASPLSGDVDGNTVYRLVYTGLYEVDAGDLFDFNITTNTDAI